MVWLTVHPFVDLPFHLAAATIRRFYDAPHTAFRDYFIVERLFPEPNVLHLLITSSRIFPSVDAANHVVLAAYVAAIPLLVRAIIRRVGGNVWFALLAFLFLYNYNLMWGFAGFFLSIPLVLAFVYFLLTFTERPTPARTTAMAAALLVLFMCHALAVLFALSIVTLTILVMRDPTRTRRAVLAMLPALGIVAWWWVTSPRESRSDTSGFLLQYYQTEYLQTFLAARKRLLTHDHAHVAAGFRGVAFGLAISAAIVGLLLMKWRDWRATLTALWRTPSGRVPLIFATSAALCCLLLPDRLPEETALFERFSVYLWLSLIVLGSVLWRHARGLWPAVAIGLIVLAGQAVRLEYFWAFSRTVEGFTPAFFPEATRGERLFGLIYQPKFRDHPIFAHYPDYYITWRHGIATTEIAQFRFGTVRTRPDGRTLPMYDTSPNANSYSTEHLDFDYLLVRGSLPATLPMTDFRETRHAADWRIFERRPPSP